MMLFGLFPVVKALVMLTVSFFVLFVVSKTESKALKQFGRILAVTFCIIAAYLIITALYLSVTGKPCSYKSMPYKYMPHKQMYRGRPGMMKNK